MKMKLRHPLIIRILHWWNMISITLLILTGFYIHNPVSFPLFPSMDVARLIHFIFMYLVIFGLIARVYYAIAAGDYRNILFRPRDIKNFPSMIKYYLFLNKDHPDYGKYNPGQKMMYCGWGILIIIQAITGFILYLPDVFGGLANFLGGFTLIRMIHYVVCWLFVYSVAVHIYLDVAEGLPVLFSMFTGKIPADWRHGVEPPDVPLHGRKWQHSRAEHWGQSR